MRRSTDATKTHATAVCAASHEEAAMNTLDELDALSMRTDLPAFRAGDTL